MLTLFKWAIIVTSQDRQNVEKLIRLLKDSEKSIDFKLPDPEVLLVDIGLSHTIDTAMAIMGENRNNLNTIIVAVLPTSNAEAYAAVKKRCFDYKVPSQCILAKCLIGNDVKLLPICKNMLDLISSMLGGERWAICNTMKNIMVVGFDIHQEGGQTIGAMYAAINLRHEGYISHLDRIPVNQANVATCVANMFDKCLKSFKRGNGYLPAHIFMYRDGIVEASQLRQVIEQEPAAFKDRIKAVYGQQENPKLTYIVVNKRKNAELLQELRAEKYKNPQSGLVEDDNAATPPERYDFGIASQNAPLGCVGPTYYNVILDENGLPDDLLQKFTFQLCQLNFILGEKMDVAPDLCKMAKTIAKQALRQQQRNFEVVVLNGSEVLIDKPTST